MPTEDGLDATWESQIEFPNTGKLPDYLKKTTTSKQHTMSKTANPSGYTLKVKFVATEHFKKQFPDNSLPNWVYESKFYPTLAICEDAINQKMKSGYYAEIEKIPHYSEQAMQSYAQQQSEGFAEWIMDNCVECEYTQRWLYCNVPKTTSELYQLFTQQNQK